MFLEERRMERQKTGPEEIRDWQQILSRKHVQEPEVSITEGSLQLVNLKPGLVEAEHLQPHLLRGKNWSEREESRLVAELKKGLGRQVVDRELLGANLRDRTRLGEEQVELFIFIFQSELGSHSHFLIGSPNVDSQVTAGQLELCLRAQGLRLDRGVLNRWIITMTSMMLTIKVDTSSRYHGSGNFLYPCTSRYTQVWLGYPH